MYRLHCGVAANYRFVSCSCHCDVHNVTTASEKEEGERHQQTKVGVTAQVNQRGFSPFPSVSMFGTFAGRSSTNRIHDEPL